MSVREAMERVDSIEFAEWMAFDEISPIDDRKIESLLAQIAALYLNVHLKEGAATVPPDYFTPWMQAGIDPERQNDESMQRQLIFWTPPSLP